MKNKRYWKVKYGFNPSDRVSIPEELLQKAIYARIKGTPVQLGTHFISGSNIIEISPDYHKHTGWYDWYEPKTGEDFAQIQRDCPNYDGVLELHKEVVHGLIKSGQAMRLSNESIPIDESRLLERQKSPEGLVPLAKLLPQ